MSDKVGPKRPPKAHQFQKGQSGNPKGRPKGTRNLRTDVNELMRKTISVREDGASRRISRQEAVLLALFGKAARGDVSASKALIDMVVKLNGGGEQQPQPTNLAETDRRIVDDFLRGHGAPFKESNQ